AVNILVASSSSCARRCARGILAVGDVDMATISESVGGGTRALEAETTFPVIPPTLPLWSGATVRPARRCGEVEWGHATDGIDHGRGHPPARTRPRGAARPAPAGGARRRPARGAGPPPRRR